MGFIFYDVGQFCCFLVVACYLVLCVGFLVFCFDFCVCLWDCDFILVAFVCVKQVSGFMLICVCCFIVSVDFGFSDICRFGVFAFSGGLYFRLFAFGVLCYDCGRCGWCLVSL